MTERAKAIDKAELRSAGIDALNKALGPVGTVRFLALFRSGPTDYVEVSRRLYENQNVEKIFKRAREHWKDKEKDSSGDSHSLDKRASL